MFSRQDRSTRRRRYALRVAAYLHPGLLPRGPLSNYGWFVGLAGLLRALRRDAGSNCALITGSRFLAAAGRMGDGHLLDGVRVVAVDEVALSSKLSALGIPPNVLIKLAYSAADHPALRMLAEHIVRASAGVEPDVLLSAAMPTDFLAEAWPKALRLHIEAGPYSGNPFPRSIFFDHLGMFERSAIGRAGARLRGLTATADASDLVRAFRARNEAALASVDPFKARDLHGRFERIFLLPLQVSGWYGFDELCPYRTQFEFLFDILAAAPRDVGVVVTEHAASRRLLATSFPGQNEVLDYLRSTFPNLIYAEQFATYVSPSRFLAPRVDGVWSVSSGVGPLSLLFGKSLGAPQTSHLAGIAHATTLADFFGVLRLGAPESRDGFLAWQLERYLVPEGLYTDGVWLNDYLERRIDAAAAADPVDAFVPTADLGRLANLWIHRAPPPQAESYRSPEDSLLLSRSWRYTAPLRAIGESLRTLRARFRA